MDTELFESVMEYATQVGGFLAFAAFAYGVWKAIRKDAIKDDAEKAVYSLMTEEVKRLSAALEDAEKQLKKLRADCESEHRKRDEEVAQLNAKIKCLEDKLIGD